MKKLSVLTSRLFIGVLLAHLTACGGVTFDVQIPKATVEQQIRSKFPMEKRKGVLGVRLENPEIVLNGSTNRVEFGTDITAGAMGLVRFPGTVQLDGVPVYEPKAGAFRLGDIKIRDLAIDGIPADTLAGVRELLSSVVMPLLQQVEVYRLNPDEFTEKLALLTLRRVRIEGDSLVVTLGLGE